MTVETIDIELQRYLEHEVPTEDHPLTRSECFAKALQHGYAGEHEAEASWMLFGVSVE